MFSLCSGLMCVLWRMGRRAVERHTRWSALSLTVPQLQSKTLNRASFLKQLMNYSSKVTAQIKPLNYNSTFGMWYSDWSLSVCIDACFRLISEKPADSHTVEMSVVEVYNNEVLDLLARDEDGEAVGVKREVITTSTGTSDVPCLTYEWVTAVRL